MSRKQFTISDLISKALPGTAPTRYQKGEVIFAQGEPADSVLYIAEGKVKLMVVSEQGKEAIIAMRDRGDFLGEACLTDQKLRTATAIAMAASAIIRLEKSFLRDLIREDASFSECFLNYLLSKNVRTEQDLLDHLFNSSEKRLARALLTLANFGTEGRTESIVPKVSQETLAAMVGTTRSRVSFFMNKFRNCGFIEYNGELKVHQSLVTVLLRE